MAQAHAARTGNPYKRSLLRRQNSIDTRAGLVRAAARLWSERGYDATTIEDICATAGVSRSTYYVHFESKDQLLGELTRLTATSVAADVAAVLDVGSIDDELDAFTSGLVRRMESVPKELAALVLRRAITHVEQLGEFADGLVDFGLLLAQILERGQTAGEIRDDVDAAELGAIMGGMTMEALLRWATGHTGRAPLRGSLTLRFDLVLDGIRL